MYWHRISEIEYASELDREDFMEIKAFAKQVVAICEDKQDREKKLKALSDIILKDIEKREVLTGYAIDEAAIASAIEEHNKNIDNATSNGKSKSKSKIMTRTKYLDSQGNTGPSIRTKLYRIKKKYNINDNTDCALIDTVQNFAGSHWLADHIDEDGNIHVMEKSVTIEDEIMDTVDNVKLVEVLSKKWKRRKP